MAEKGPKEAPWGLVEYVILMFPENAKNPGALRTHNYGIYKSSEKIGFSWKPFSAIFGP